MPEDVNPPITTFQSSQNENDIWGKALVAFIFLILSFICIFCSSQGALWLIDRGQVNARAISSRQANYAPGPWIVVPRVNAKAIAAEAEADSKVLEDNTISEPIIGGLVPVPIPPLPTPTPTTAIALVPEASPTSTPTSEPAPRQPSNPLPTAAPPRPPTISAPTSLPPTVPPSTVAPTAPPPPSPPPPTLPPTDPPPTPFPTQMPTATRMPTAIATATKAPTAPPPTLPIVGFGAATYSMSEANVVATIIVVLNKAWTQPVQVNYAASNGTALAGSDYAATAGSLTFAPGQTTQTIAVPIMPDTIDELDETVLLTLSNASNATLGLPNPSTLIILDDDLPPTIAFNRLNFTVPEDAGAAAITTSLSSASVFTITANYTTANITAVAGSDYLTKTGTLIFIPNQTEQSFAVSIIDDTLNESNETVRLILGNPVNATLGSTNPATLTIVENDIPVVEFERPNYQVLEDAGPANITATLSTASSLTVTLNYASSNGSAIAGSDYLTATGALTFPPGQIITSFPVTILNDQLTNEFDETLQLTLNTPNNAILGATNPVTLTITDDDGQPTVGFVNTRYSASEGNDGGTGVVTTTIFVSLSVPSAVTVTVDYNTGNGTATAPDDYLATSGTLTIPPNQTGQSFEIIVINDSLDEAATETANLSLSNPVSATLGTSSAVLNIIDDDPLTPCTDSDLTENGEPEIGLPPDGLFYNIDCGDELIVDMGATPIRTSGSPAFDLVYYERGQTNPTGPTFIYMDWVIVQVAQSFNGPWYTVFYWGDNIVDSNTSLGQTPPYNNLPEADNRVVQTANPQLYGPAGPFNLITGIAIDIDARVPAGTYRYVRFHVPAGGDNDVVQVDAIQAIP